MTIIVSPLSQIQAVIRARRPSHMITLLDPEHVIETPAGLQPERHLRLGVYDICMPYEHMTPPDERHVLDILEFGRGWTDESSPLLVHCFAGISRSTATAFMLACERNPHVAERDIALRLRRASSTAYPNRRMVALADDLLGRSGRMVDAVEAMGPNQTGWEGTPFDLPARY
jgi:predicted protein tyrosine phosphatase